MLVEALPSDWWWWMHAVATWAMVGIIWMVQVVVYPGFAKVPVAGFVDWHRDYTRRMGFVVGPLMLAEMVGALTWVLRRPDSVRAWMAAGTLGAIWVCTVLVQVRQHQRLSEQHDVALIRRLVRGNWLRTLLWTFRGFCLFVTISVP